MRNLLIPLLCILLSGCFDLQDEITFRDDGTVRLVRKLAIASDVLALQKQPLSDLCRTMQAAQAKVEIDTLGTDEVCVVTIDTTIDKLNAVVADLQPAEFVSTRHRLNLKVAPEGDAYRLGLLVTFDTKEAHDHTGLTESAKQLVISQWTRRSLSWLVKAPIVLETTSGMSAGENSVSYSIPLSNLLREQDQAYVFTVLFRLKPPKPPGFWDKVRAIFG